MAFVKFQCANEKKEKERGILYFSRRQKLHSKKELKKINRKFTQTQEVVEYAYATQVSTPRNAYYGAN